MITRHPLFWGLIILVSACSGNDSKDAGLVSDEEGGRTCTEDIECDDGRFCNGVEVCDTGTCQPGEPVSCDDDDPCTEDLCSDEHAQCLFTIVDADGDGYGDETCGGIDCDDQDFSVNPAASETCDDIDRNCDGLAAPDKDEDGFGDALCEGDDCDDEDGSVNPNAEEECEDNRDTDCDGIIGPDEDRDGYGDRSCGGNDCDDNNEMIYPGAPEGCDTVDNDCDGDATEEESDHDGDDFLALSCGGDDCDDSDPHIYPGATERCNGKDDNCNLSTDEVFDCVFNSEQPCVTSCGSVGLGLCSADCVWLTCTPPLETCDGVDNDCDGVKDNGYPCIAADVGEACVTHCGSVGRDFCSVATCTWECVPPQEVCNGEDDNCDSICDEGWDCCEGVSEACETSCGTPGRRQCQLGCSWGPCYPDEGRCDDDAGADVGTDADSNTDTDSDTDVSTDRCFTNLDCYDESYCNGLERCDPHDPWANEFGCLPSRSPIICMPFGQRCDDILKRCVTDCEVTEDGDGDGLVSVDCNGSDCRDHEDRNEHDILERCNGTDDDCDGVIDGIGSIWQATKTVDDESFRSLSASWNGDELGIAHCSPHGVYFNVFSRRSFMFPDWIHVKSAETTFPLSANILWTGDAFSLIWLHDLESAEGDVYYNRISADGTVLPGDVRVTNTTATPRDPSLAWTGTELGVVWSEMELGNDYSQLYFIRISDSSVVMGEPLRVTYSTTNAIQASLVWADGEYGLAWTEDRFTEDDIFFNRISADGLAVLDNDLRVTETSTIASMPSLVWTGLEYGLTWIDERNVDVKMIGFNRISQDGQVLAADAFFGRNPVDQSLVWTGDEYGHVMSDYLGSVYLRSMSSAGALTDEAELKDWYVSSTRSNSVFIDSNEENTLGIGWLEVTHSSTPFRVLAMLYGECPNLH